MSDTMNDNIVEAINDLTRVTIAVHGQFATKADAIRRLYELSIPASRIAIILAIPLNTVTSILAKDRKKLKKASESSKSDGEIVAGGPNG